MYLIEGAGHPAAGRLTKLRLGSADALAVVARSRQLGRLEAVELTGRHAVTSGDVVRELLANPALPALKRLWLNCVAPANVRLTADDTARLRDRFGTGYTAQTYPY